MDAGTGRDVRRMPAAPRGRLINREKCYLRPRFTHADMRRMEKERLHDNLSGRPRRDRNISRFGHDQLYYCRLTNSAL
ncbi:hypothetical protein EVAR_47030_1 [Eumeta japonica]|uniref:Uncharacterized protein n=1 Tax=Eumeta variegata TaxID=151549 RepID=A0A4C1XHE2_EUMVA|nr:hypothetical protein EVAR_47030_1 [Eumeta japonica]